MKLPPEQEAIRAKCFHPSGTFVEFPEGDVETSIPQRFEKIASKFPHQIAVKNAAETLTYARLSFISNQIARTILSRIGSPGVPVALLFGHRPAFVAAILAVLKSANLYVALDSSYPVDRLSYMIEDSTAKLILTDNENYGLACKLVAEGMEIINIEDLDAQICGDNLNLTVTPFNYAYVVYSSGSTGRPKGVLHNHRNVLYSVFVETKHLRVCTEDGVGLCHPFSSSASTKYLFGALLNGASLVLIDVKGEGLGRLRLWLIDEGVTLCDFTVTLFRSLAHSLTNSENFPSLRLIILGSEAITTNDVALYKRLFHPQSILVILYATSETATIRNYFVDRTTGDSRSAVPVGYPIEGKAIALFDESGNSLEPGNVGEIAVKSRYLAVGYWRQPDLTEDRFLPDPSGGDERIYLTGDVGRLDADGCLFHLGRKDNRIKIRGFTVEPVEAEQLLLRHPAVKAAAVVGRRSDSGEPRLVAYCVPTPEAAPTVSELRSFLTQKLPEYMVPSAFVLLGSLPLTPNGKIDRRALPDPGQSRPNLDTPFAMPRSLVEEVLARIWAEVLSLDRVGIHDNFFDLGGHSLAATRVVTQVIRHFQLEIPPKKLFESPTISEMAAAITEHQVKRLGNEEFENILAELESLPDEEAGRLASEGRGKNSKS